MLQIDDKRYSEIDFQKSYELFDSIFNFHNSSKAKIAVCLQDTQVWLALCLYLKQHNASVMPIHSSTPLQAAKRLAETAGCDTLYFQDITQTISFSVNETSDIDLNQTEASGLIQMSSGTTGEPKCIVRSWQSIDIEIKGYINAFDLPKDMTPVIACPTTHSYGLISGVLAALARGKAPIVTTSINPKYLIKQLVSLDRPLLYASPTLLRGLMRLWPKETQLHAVMTSGTMMSQAVFDELRPKITHLFQQYGCSEAGCISVNQDMREPQHIGIPLPHWQVQAGDSINNLAEIIVTPKAEFSEVLNVIHTQDLGFIQKNDSDAASSALHYVSRQDDTIIVAGLNVYPQQVEDIILSHPDIMDAVIFKIEDKLAGHRVCLNFVAGPSNPDLQTADVRAWCQHQMAEYQIPQNLRSVEKITRMANGKINRKQLAKQLFEESESKESISATQLKTDTSCSAVNHKHSLSS